jgi:hypothetical protein
MAKMEQSTEAPEFGYPEVYDSISLIATTEALPENAQNSAHHVKQILIRAARAHNRERTDERDYLFKVAHFVEGAFRLAPEVVPPIDNQNAANMICVFAQHSLLYPIIDWRGHAYATFIAMRAKELVAGTVYTSAASAAIPAAMALARRCDDQAFAWARENAPPAERDESE